MLQPDWGENDGCVRAPVPGQATAREASAAPPKSQAPAVLRVRASAWFGAGGREAQE